MDDVQGTLDDAQERAAAVRSGVFRVVTTYQLRV